MRIRKQKTGQKRTGRSLAEIRADLDRVNAEIAASEALQQQEEDLLADVKDILDARIREHFAAEFAAIAEREERLKQLRLESKPSEASRRLLWDEEKWAEMVPGLSVTWDEPNGWRGTSSTHAKVLQVTDSRVQIDIGGVRHDRVKWVSLDSLHIIRRRDIAAD